MKIRWSLAVLVVGLLWGAAALAEKAAARRVPMLLRVAAVPLPDQQAPPPRRWAPTKPPSAPKPAPVPPDSPLAQPQESPADRVFPVDNDPVQAVETFVQRNVKEADDAIRSLNQEAEALRVRLAKVEAALARWQAVTTALQPSIQPPGESTPPQPAKTPDNAASPDPSVPPAVPQPTAFPPEEPAPLALPEPTILSR